MTSENYIGYSLIVNPGVRIGLVCLPENCSVVHAAVNLPENPPAGNLPARTSGGELGPNNGLAIGKRLLGLRRVTCLGDHPPSSRYAHEPDGALPPSVVPECFNRESSGLCSLINPVTDLILSHWTPARRHTGETSFLDS